MPVTKREARKGTQLLVDGEVLDEARAIAVVREVSVAEVWREAINLDAQSQEYADKLNQLDYWLEELGVDRSRALEWMVKRGINFEVLADSATTTALMVEALS